MGSEAETLVAELALPPWAACVVEFPDGRVAYLIPQMFNVRISVSPNREAEWFDDIYDYLDATTALPAFLCWFARDGEGEPEGWIRHKPSGRRRRD